MRGPESAGGNNLSKWKVVSGLESGGGRLKDMTESEGQALREDGKWGVKLSQMTNKQEKNVIWLQT